MKTKANALDRSISSRSKQVLQFAEAKAKEVSDWLELHSALYDANGKASQLFPNEADRRAYMRTKEYKKVNALIESLPQPKSGAVREQISTANGAISVRLPRSVHAALLAEAEAEGVSLNQLCTAKLIAQLRAVL